MTENHNNKRKILYIITKSNWGGAQRYVFDLVTNLPTNWDSVVAFGGNGVLNEKLANAKIRTINIPNLERNISVFGDVSVFFSLIKLFLREKPSIVHLNSSKIGGLGAFAGRIYNGIQKVKSLSAKNNKQEIKIIFTAHGWAFNEPRNFLQKTIIKLLSWITIFLSHNTIAVSQKDYTQSMNMLFVNKKISIIHNGVGKMQFFAQNIAREILLGNNLKKINDDTILIGIIAELTKNKGLKYAIDAIEKFGKKKNNTTKTTTKIPPIAFVIIGDGEDKIKLANILKNKKLTKKIFLVGFKKNASSLLRAFDIFMLPSVKEGLPYVLLEAGMAKLPVIASNVGGIPEVIDDMKSGILVRAKEPIEIYKAINLMLEDKMRMHRFGLSLNGKVNIEYSLDEMIKKTIAVYE